MEKCVKGSWHVKQCFEKNLSGFIFLSALDEVWSCGDTHVVSVWNANVWGGKKNLGNFEVFSFFSFSFSFFFFFFSCQ